MAETELIAETNRLLQELLRKEAEQRAEGERMREKFETERGARDAKREEARKAGLREQGLPEEAVEGSDADWDARRKATMGRSKENLATAVEKDRAYRDELLAELRVQSDLLRQIAERLAR